MPVPYLFQENFETGTLGNFDSETDTQSKLRIAHYTHLYASPVREMPWRGAYAAHIDLSLGTADAYFEEAFAVAADETRHVRFYVYAQDLVMAASDRFTIFAMQSAGPVDEIVIDIRNNAGTIEILAAETGAAATIRASALSQNRWHCVELDINIDAGGGNDGTVTFTLDGAPVGAIITGLDQAAIAQMRLGAIGIDAGTTRGHILFDEFVADNVRIFPLERRYGTTRHYAQTSHLAIGPGQLEEVYLRDGGGNDAVCTLYDTDIADLSAPRILQTLTLTSGERVGDPWLSIGTFARGCYAVLTGVGAELTVTLRNGTMSAGEVKDIAASRH